MDSSATATDSVGVLDLFLGDLGAAVSVSSSITMVVVVVDVVWRSISTSITPLTGSFDFRDFDFFLRSKSSSLETTVELPSEVAGALRAGVVAWDLGFRLRGFSSESLATESISSFDGTRDIPIGAFVVSIAQG